VRVRVRVEKEAGRQDDCASGEFVCLLCDELDIRALVRDVAWKIRTGVRLGLEVANPWSLFISYHIILYHIPILIVIAYYNIPHLIGHISSVG
jgi:hypothetical protein